MATTLIAFDSGKTLTVEHDIQEVSDSLADGRERGVLVTFVMIGGDQRIDASPEHVAYVLDAGA